MRRPHSLVMQVQKITYLCGGMLRLIHLLYSELEVIKACGEEGTPPPLVSLHSRGNISCESRDQEQQQSRPLQLIVNSKPLLFSRQKYCCTLSVYLTSSVQIEVAFQDKQKKPFRHLCTLGVTSNNEHIIIRQARDRDVPLPIRMSVQ